MNRLKFSFLALSLIILLTTRVEAQNKTAISFEEAVRTALSKNPAITASDFEIKSVDFERKATKSLRSPQIGLMANYTYMSKDISLDFNAYKGDAKNIIGGLFPQIGASPIVGGLFAADWSYQLMKDNFAVVGATMKMPIYMGGKINAAYNFSKLKVEEATQKQMQLKGELFSELVERYYGLVLANEVVNVRKEVVKGMQHHFNDATELEKNGIIAKGERLYSQMHLSKAESEMQKSVRDAETINYALGNTLAHNADYLPTSKIFIGVSLKEVAYYKTIAQSANPQLQQVRIKEMMAKEGLKASRSEFIPHLTAIGGVAAYSENIPDILPRAAVGVNLTFNIFNGLNREFKHSSAKMKIKQVEALNAKVTEDIGTMVEKVYAELISLREQYMSAESTIKFATEYLRIKERAFAEGMGSSSDVVDARLNLAKATIERLQMAYGYNVALSKLCQLCGDNSIFRSNF